MQMQHPFSSPKPGLNRFLSCETLFSGTWAFAKETVSNETIEHCQAVLALVAHVESHSCESLAGKTW